MMNGASNSDAKEQSRCFVCDAEVLGRSYALATCRTQNSQTRVIEKLGELVGEGYMVVISEDDVICRSCGILVNTLDRLETEMRKARDHILRFLEQKYSLEDGELRSNGDKPKPCQPPQITRSGAKEISVCCVDPPNESDLNPGDKKIPTKSHPWLQCDKCKYTTHLNSFMMHHLRDHIKQRIFCDNCGLYSSDKRHSCNEANDLGNKENETDNSGTVTKNDPTKITLLEQAQSILPITQTTPPPLIGLSNCDHLYISSTLPMSDSTSSQQSVYVLQSMADVDNLRKTTRSGSNPVQETEVKDRGEGKKQILTLKEDGSLEMVEIMPWNETEAPNINPTITFE